jgi:hypothetical protein
MNVLIGASAQAESLTAAARDHKPFCQECDPPPREEGG